jgi:hypothetical protein
MYRHGALAQAGILLEFPKQPKPPVVVVVVLIHPVLLMYCPVKYIR